MFHISALALCEALVTSCILTLGVLQHRHLDTVLHSCLALHDRGGHWSVAENQRLCSPSSTAQRAPAGAGGALPMLGNNVGCAHLWCHLNLCAVAHHEKRPHLLTAYFRRRVCTVCQLCTSCARHPSVMGGMGRRWICM